MEVILIFETLWYSRSEIMQRRVEKLNGLDEPDHAEQRELDTLGKQYPAGKHGQS